MTRLSMKVEKFLSLAFMPVPRGRYASTRRAGVSGGEKPDCSPNLLAGLPAFQ
ncbi:hypothetical protein EI77_04440 [Prosthecobacter fusiformis]|uniref:Uncharacterized protein n=1 Tax=Prosthecobacter fusiformis TaxID=48464 RepID=A0A4R7RIY5_9BACT|nr:hypothetical protein [Prosthecobacter fusiformis]TDU63231.1 hypothetical protein EI77_04440 [Prosthecobacter fusiformis]